MDDAAWSTAVEALARSADEMHILARCLDVRGHLDEYRASREDLAGALAADALDQALGLLEELANGEASRLAATVRSVLHALPPPLE